MSAMGGAVELSLHASGRLTVGGTKRCKSVAACPLCGENIRHRRSTELDGIIAGAQSEGHHVFLVTATIKHRAGDELSWLLACVQEAWTKAWSGSAMKRHGYIGQARAWDYTYGDAGWHPHIHAIVVIDASVPRDIARTFVDSRFTVYRDALAAKGRTAAKGKLKLKDGEMVLVSPGWDVQPVNDAGEVVASYVSGIAKLWSAGTEIAMNVHKRASVTSWAILRCAVEGETIPGSVIAGWAPGRLWAVWAEYETATKGRQQIVIGKALHRFVADELVDDDEAAHGIDETEIVYAESIPTPVWEWHLERGTTYELLEACEDRGAVFLPPGLLLTG